MNKLGTKLGAIAMSAVMALTFAPSAAITSLAASGDGLLDATLGVEAVEGLYNPNSGEHLFTTDDLEVSNLVNNHGWNYEGVKWKAPYSSKVPVYRLYNPNTGDHHYTTSLDERNTNLLQGWVNDNNGNPVFYGADSADPDAIPVYRLFNPNETTGTHHYTTSAKEKADCVTAGWNDEGSTFSGYPKDYEPVKEELTVSISNTTPKVGNTLVATVVDRNGKDVSDNVKFQWYLDDEKLDGETDETLDVTVGMIGSTIKVTATAENGNTFSSVPTAPVDDEIYTFDIKSAKATKVNEITVTFADAVDAENVTFAVTKGTESVPIEKVEATDWSLNEDGDVVVTLKTSANMIKGTYTVTATDSVTKDTAYANFEVLDKQTVTKIVIKNTKAYTNANDAADKAHTEAYAYYDVLDQYDQSMRASASIQWAGSCEIKADKANGMLTFTKSGNDNKKAWVYGEKIYITGVHTKTGVAKSETLTVDTEQSLNSIDVVGFLKKGTSDIIDDLPEDFKEYEYYMLFHALDQNDCPLKADKIGREDVTFTSDSPLVVKEVTFEGGDEDDTDKKPFTVNGTEYNAVYVNPGINVSKGGEVNVTAIANKTGNKTIHNFIVGEDPVVVTFTLGSPSGVVADGDTGVNIPFTAAEADGTPITNFRALAKQEIFNTLSFNASEGTLRLAEQDNRKAKLTWSDDAKYYAAEINGETNEPWSYSVTTDDIDRPVSLTVVVVGGDPSNEMLYVSDKRRPNAIADVHLSDVYVEGDDIDIKMTGTDKTDSFKYYDQYGKQIGTTWGADNGFFAAAKKGNVLKNTDFAGYKFGVRIEYTGTGKIEYTHEDATAESKTGNTIDGKKVVIESGQTAAYNTTKDIKSVATGEGFKFDIAKFKDTDGEEGPDVTVDDPDDWDSVSPSKYHGLTVVDITQVKNFKIGDLNTFYTGELDATGDKIIGAGNYTEAATASDAAITFIEALKSDPEAEAHAKADPSGIRVEGGDYQQEVKVSGTWNGKPVSIPGDYFTISTTKGSLEDNNGDDDKFDTIGKILLSDLYEKTTANGNAKPAGQDEVVATIVQLYDDAGHPIGAPVTYDTAKAPITYSDQAPVATDIKGLKDAYTFKTNDTKVIFYDADQGLLVAQKHGNNDGSLTVVDQYGVTLDDKALEFTISNAVEDKEGYAENNFAVDNNGTPNPTIKGAELGDTFDLVVSIAGTTIKKTTKVTIGADYLASIVNSTNYYTKGDNGQKPLKDTLEAQRKAGLQ